MWIALDIVFVYTYRIHLFTRIIQFLTEKDRKKKYRQMARFIFFFSFVEKKKEVHRFTDREGRSFNENPSVFVTFHIVWNSLLLFGRKKSRRCGGGWIETAQMRIVSSKSGEKIRADCNEDIGNFTVLFFSVFLESQNFHKLISFARVFNCFSFSRNFGIL